MSDSFWRPSDEQRRTILLLEALALLHDVGKLTNKFVASEADRTISFNYQRVLNPGDVYSQEVIERGLLLPPVVRRQEEKPDPITELFSSAVPAPVDVRDIAPEMKLCQIHSWEQQIYSLAELILLTAPRYACRDLTPIFGRSMQPAKLVGKLHGVAHYEKEGGTPQPRSDTYYTATPFGVEKALEDLDDALKNLPLKDLSEVITKKRKEWLESLRYELSKGVADTRRPTNEVSLWDWGYIVATMAKAAAAWIFKHGWPENSNNLPFRTLRINLNRLERYSRSHKISDLLGVRQAIDDAFDRVQRLLEETYALSNCLYHDETGAYYLFPDLGYSDEEMAELRWDIQAQFPSDLRPQVHLDERVTVGQLDNDKTLASKLVAEPRQQVLKEPPVRADNNLYLFETEWGEARPENAGICTVCGVRPVGYPRQGSLPEVERELARWATQDKAERRNICRVCLDRRGRRAQEWAERELDGTIWTDEVADANGRLALFVGKLGLKGWLDGSLLSTIQVTSRTTKTPSPARLYRIAETARAFWQRVIDEVTPDAVGQRPFRLALYLSGNDLPDLGEFHAYELDVDGLALNVVWDKPNDRFLTAENLAYFARRWEIPLDALTNRLANRIFDILEPSEFGRPGQVLNTVHIERVEKLDGYRPTISLLAEPSVCMVLIPADKALALARAVKQMYEQQMGRVRDRLPLYLGLVFAPRRTPVRAILEAGRSMLDMAGQFDMSTGAGWEGWRLVANNSLNPGSRELVFDNGITWQVPVLAGDCQTKDEWYPRFLEGDSWDRKRAKHVNDLRKRHSGMPKDRGWRVWVRPSRFDFEFLDTTARRFEIHYDENGRRPRRTRPFYLEDLDRLETLWGYMKRLTKTQRHQVIRTIEATREAWYGQDSDGQSANDDVFKQFVHDTLAGAAWPKGQPWVNIPQEWQDKLIQAGARGELADLAELHMEILKE